MDMKPVALSNVSGTTDAPLKESDASRRPRRSTASGPPEPVTSSPEAPEEQAIAVKLGAPSRSEEQSDPASEADRADNPVMNEFLTNPRYKLSFKIDEGTNDVVVTVIDPETDDVIRQIPPEEMLRLAERLDATRGSLVSSKV